MLCELIGGPVDGHKVEIDGPRYPKTISVPRRIGLHSYTREEYRAAYINCGVAYYLHQSINPPTTSPRT